MRSRGVEVRRQSIIPTTAIAINSLSARVDARFGYESAVLRIR
jgi:hypothetical protein